MCIFENTNPTVQANTMVKKFFSNIKCAIENCGHLIGTKKAIYNTRLLSIKPAMQ